MWQKTKEKLAKEILLSLYQSGMIKTWYRDNPKGWILTSGIWSPFYIQLRPLCCYPAILESVGHALGKLIKNEIGDGTKCVGIAMTGIPIAIAISILEDIPSGFTRKIECVKNVQEFKQCLNKYGEHEMVEGNFENGDKIVLIDDLVTKFDSKFVAIEEVKFEMARRGIKKVSINDVVVLLDREQGAEKIASENGIKLHSLIPFKTKGLRWLSDIMSDEEIQIITEYLECPENLQNKERQYELSKITKNISKC